MSHVTYTHLEYHGFCIIEIQLIYCHVVVLVSGYYKFIKYLIHV